MTKREAQDRGISQGPKGLWVCNTLKETGVPTATVISSDYKNASARHDGIKLPQNHIRTSIMPSSHLQLSQTLRRTPLSRFKTRLQKWGRDLKIDHRTVIDSRTKIFHETKDRGCILIKDFFVELNLFEGSSSVMKNVLWDRSRSWKPNWWREGSFNKQIVSKLTANRNCSGQPNWLKLTGTKSPETTTRPWGPDW